MTRHHPMTPNSWTCAGIPAYAVHGHVMATHPQPVP